MYSREQDGETYTFEPSGGLLNASLVMRDRETDSWWSILTEEAIHGPAEGRRLEQIPGAVKTTWAEWRALHPTSRVLSVGGVEHRPESPYDDYFASERTFRDLEASDRRLGAKELVYGFHRGSRPHAVPHARFRKGGAVFRFGDRDLFLYRQADDSFYRSTVAVLAAEGAEIVFRDGGWELTGGERAARFDPGRRVFAGAEDLAEPFEGFDTYWYIWSLSNPGGEILKPAKKR